MLIRGQSSLELLRIVQLARKPGDVVGEERDKNALVLMRLDGALWQITWHSRLYHTNAYASACVPTLGTVNYRVCHATYSRS